MSQDLPSALKSRISERSIPSSAVSADDDYGKLIAMDQIAPLDRHIRVLFDVGEHGRITRVNEPDPEYGPPIMFLALGRTEYRIVFSEDAPEALVTAMQDEVTGLGPWNGEQSASTRISALRHIIERWLPVAVVTHGVAFTFSEHMSESNIDGITPIDEPNRELLAKNFPYTLANLDTRSPVIGVVRDGAVVAACYSARRRAYAAEAGVDTIADYRKQGFASAVVSEWGTAVRRMGMVPLYSTEWNNNASMLVAAKLDLVSYAETISFR